MKKSPESEGIGKKRKLTVNYRKASGKPLALAMGMNTVVALA
jgi:hypothetical protein